MQRRDRAFTLIELLVAIGLMCLLISVLLPLLNRARERAARLSSSVETRIIQSISGPPGNPPAAAEGDLPPALIKTFAADVTLTPRLSVGTIQPESIYEAKFVARFAATGTTGEKSAINLPLPPQVVSLADLSVNVNGQPSDAVTLNGDQLLWSGALGETPTSFDVTYTAVGRGIYQLATPKARILDRFQINLTAAGSDVRMLELSMQPTKPPQQNKGSTSYTWDYKNLMFGRPIALDVLGIAPVDRLGELTWLGPMSVVVFGLMLGLVTHAFNVAHFDKWMLLLVLGTFTGAYPLMYFTQEYIPLNRAMVLCGTVVLIIIATRLVTIMPWRIALVGIVLPAAVIMGLTLVAAVKTNLQGMVLTAMSLGLFVIAMMLAPRLQAVRRLAAIPTIGTTGPTPTPA
jgi:prepilin-type N-terminal cleavage/methylation domain-containing protein